MDIGDQVEIAALYDAWRKSELQEGRSGTPAEWGAHLVAERNAHIVSELDEILDNPDAEDPAWALDCIRALMENA